MLDERGMTGAKPVVNPALARNNDDVDEEEARTEEHRISCKTLTLFTDRDCA